MQKHCQIKIKKYKSNKKTVFIINFNKLKFFMVKRNFGSDAFATPLLGHLGSQF